MSRTPLAKALKQIFRLAEFTNANGLSANQALEMHAQARLTRREALLRGLEAAALTPFALASLQEAMASELTKKLRAGRAARRHMASVDGPVVIIGAGTAGLTAAYRLINANVPCVIYEGGSRVGGRMFTQRGFNADNMFCERGGELVDSDHAELIALCGEVGLEIQPLVETDNSLNMELYFINGRYYKVADLLHAFKPLAAQVAADQKKIFGNHNQDTPTYRKPFRSMAFDKMTLRKYLYGKSEVDKWVLDLVNICYTGEYGLETDEQSALNLICQISTQPSNEVEAGKRVREYKLLGESDESRRIKGGNASLPEKLAFVMASTVPIHQQHELVKISDNGSELTLTFDNSGQTVEVRASQVISAIPFTTLRDVEGIDDLNMDPRKKSCIQKLGYGTNAKVMTGYKSKVWRHLDAEHKSNGLAYTDTVGQEIWETSRMQPGDSGIITNFVGGNTGKNLQPDDYKKMLDAINSVFPGSKETFDGNKVVQLWPKWKFTKGSYSCPLPGHYNEFVGNAGEPELDGRLFFAGEHTSVEFAGFMNGAVSSGNRVAKEVLSARGMVVPTAANNKKKIG